MAHVPVLVEMHPACRDHDAGPAHPERPDRLGAVRAGLAEAGVDADAVVTPEHPASRTDLARVHTAAYLDAVEGLCRAGGGALDPDTAVSAGSWRAALTAAGAGLDAVERLRAGEADAAFVAVRPPGHHATSARAMGFCLVNNVAVTAAALADAGERVLVVDFDAHHGNGTQEAFYADGRVTYVSLHQWPLYPGTGRLEETGTGAGRGATVNIPLPRGTTGDTYLAAVDEVVVPVAERVAPTWLVVSAGFDAHRDDPLTRLGLSAGDFGELTARLCRLVPAGRRVAILEGGYDLDALALSTAACVGALAGERLRPEPLTSGGPGRDAVDAARRVHERVAVGEEA